MKQILFTLLLFTGYLQAQTYPVNPTKFGKISLNTNGVSTSTSKINTQESDGQINYIDAANLPVPTTVTNALELKTTVSAGAVSGFELTNNGNGTVNIDSGIAYLRSTNDPYANIIKYPISAVTNLALTDNANNYVLVDYNGGSPTITVTTNGSTINTQTNSIAYVIARVGNDLEYLNLVGQNVDPNAKIRIRFLNQEGIRRASGAILGFSNRNLTLTSGVLFSGLIRVNSAAFNTVSPDTFTLAYNNGSTWTRTTAQTQVNNTQYNVSGVLTTMPNNTFRTDYVYLLPNNPSKLYVVMGTTTYGSLTLAKGAPRPSSLPVELQVLGLEVGRLFIEKNSAAIAEVQSSFANDFVGAAVPEHNSLSGLQGGSAGEYNHLTNAQISLVNGSEQTANKATDFTTVNNTLYPSVQAVKTQLDLKANDSEAVHKTGDETKNGNLGVNSLILATNAIGSVTNEIKQTVGVDDFWKIYGKTDVSDRSEMVFEVGDNGMPFSGVGQRFRFHYDATADGTAKDPLIIDYNTISVNADLSVSGLVSAFNGTLIGGTLTSGYIPKSTGSNSLGNSLIYDSGMNIGLGTSSPFSATNQRSLTIDGANASRLDLFSGGTRRGGIYGDVGLVNIGSVTNIPLTFSTFDTERGRFTASGNFEVDANISATSYTGGATLTGTPTAPTAAPGSTGTQIANLNFVQGVARPYKVYTALLSQSGTSAPVATVLENTLGGTVVWGYSSAGEYSGTLTGAFVLNKTAVFITALGANQNIYGISRNGANAIAVRTRDFVGASDGILDDTTIEIRVYN
ncbi:hypothetical protein [uncultured Empedobacter sp.]|uniref:hypothetical protein n=1 Tax=uncultured Empedobacter sp. TaxID=410844 RepID=UPI0025FB726D|nr:hypothetical protein [uncultured Empedobacter sp.]